ncbi:MAG: hypothetical protein Nk1A_6920 [Endomicrobiia bacterium]|nr:MAG: hypothetical protein Nk1A_6920 [Endomicrobiia bacterium]
MANVKKEVDDEYIVHPERRWWTYYSEDGEYCCECEAIWSEENKGKPKHETYGERDENGVFTCTETCEDGYKMVYRLTPIEENSKDIENKTTS